MKSIRPKTEKRNPLAEALRAQAQVLLATADALEAQTIETTTADPNEVRIVERWAEEYPGIKPYTLTQARKSGSLAAFIPSGRKRGYVCTRAAVEAFLKGSPATVKAKPIAANDPSADEYLALLGGSKR